MDQTVRAVKEPVDHIMRPRLPWRPSEAALTECGYDASKVKTITREEHLLRTKNYGRQRTAMLTCMTCMQTAERWSTWEEDPRDAVAREIQWESGPFRKPRGTRLLDELVTIAALIQAHPDEFQRLLVVTQQRREWNERKEKEK